MSFHVDGCTPKEIAVKKSGLQSGEGTADSANHIFSQQLFDAG